MNNETVKGEAEKLGGKVKEAAGNLTNDSGLKSEGQADQVKGEAHKIAGQVKDAVKNAAEQLKDKNKQ